MKKRIDITDLVLAMNKRIKVNGDVRRVALETGISERSLHEWRYQIKRSRKAWGSALTRAALERWVN